MPLQLADRVRETTTTTGTGTVTLAGPATGCTTFTSAITTGNPVYYVIAAQDGSAWEVGQGVLVTTSTLTRETVFRSSNSNALVNFGAGTKDVFLDFPAVLASCIPLPYGDGSDGDVTLPGSTTTLTRDMHYRNLTFVAASVINTAGYRIYVSNTLDLSAVTAAARIYVTGVAGSAGSGARKGGRGGGGTARGVRGALGISVGYSGSASTTGGNDGQYGKDSEGWGGKGGAGGDGTNTLGGLGGDVQPWPYRQWGMVMSKTELAGGSGGGGAGNSTSTAAYTGGAGGEGAPGIFVACRTLNRASANAAGTIISTGGAGANDGVSNALCGSGGGGGGGAVILITGKLSGTSATNLLRSVGGAGASQTTAGNGGAGGTCALIVMDTGAETTSGPTAGSGTTGGTTSLTV